MPDTLARSRVIRAEVSAVVTRADGSTEDLGVIGYSHRNIFRRLSFRIRKMLGMRVGRTF